MKFIGLQYPLVKTPKGVLAHSSDIPQIKADLLQLLLTNPGERVMLPEYGVPLRRLVFEPNDTRLEMAARNMIAEAIQKWEPRVEIKDIIVSSQIDASDLSPLDSRDERGGILSIKILFVDPEKIDSVEQLAVEVPLGSGG
jgi:phage baseplate assembly protein W